MIASIAARLASRRQHDHLVSLLRQRTAVEAAANLVPLEPGGAQSRPWQICHGRFEVAFNCHDETVESSLRLTAPNR
jgi:hypothetical protein